MVKLKIIGLFFNPFSFNGNQNYLHALIFYVNGSKMISN